MAFEMVALCHFEYSDIPLLVRISISKIQDGGQLPS